MYIWNQTENHSIKFFLSLFVGLSILSCGRARFELTTPGSNDHGGSEQPQETIPQNASPYDNELLPPASDDDGLHAQVVVIRDGIIVTRVPIGIPVRIAPSPDTADADNKDQRACRNPGISSARYVISDGTSQTIQRSGGCEDLSIPKTFLTPGRVSIEMTVTTDEGETKTTKTIIEVFDPQNPGSGIPTDKDEGWPTQKP